MNENIISRLKSGNFAVENLNIAYKKFPPPAPFVINLADDRKDLSEMIFYIISGTLYIDQDDTRIEFPEGSLVYFPLGTVSPGAWTIGECGEFYRINFVLRQDDGFLSLSSKPELLYSDINLEMYTSFREMYEAWVGDITGHLSCDRLGLISNFLGILHKLILLAPSNTVSEKQNSIYKALMHLENHYCTDVTTQELAELCHMNQCTFRKLFKELHGCSPVKYRNRLRILKAKELLFSGQYTVKEVAEMMNFSDTAYFNRAFKKEFGLPPSEYKIK